MSERTAHTIVVLVGLGLFAYTGIRALLADSAPGRVFKQLWAIAATTLLLTFLADLVPAIAGPFAIAVGLAYVTAGEGVSDLLDRVTAPPRTPSTVPRPRSSAA